LARALVLQQKPDEARKTLQDVVARDPNNGAARALLGQLSIDSGTWDEATTHLEKAIRLDPLNLKVAVGLARCYRAKSRPDKALTLLETRRRQGADDKSYHWETAQTLRALGRGADAQRELKLVQQIEEFNREVLAFVPPALYIH
jgi:predicted Zn-dependent protease